MIYNILCPVGLHYALYRFILEFIIALLYEGVSLADFCLRANYILACKLFFSRQFRKIICTLKYNLHAKKVRKYKETIKPFEYKRITDIISAASINFSLYMSFNDPEAFLGLFGLFQAFFGLFWFFLSMLYVSFIRCKYVALY